MTTVSRGSSTLLRRIPPAAARGPSSPRHRTVTDITELGGDAAAACCDSGREDAGQRGLDRQRARAADVIVVAVEHDAVALTGAALRVAQRGAEVDHRDAGLRRERVDQGMRVRLSL